jgi:hypothetical protein
MQQLQLAVAGLEQALACPPQVQRTWRHLVRQRMASVGDALSAEVVIDDAQVTARARRLHRERTRLLERLGMMGTRLVDPAEDALEDTEDAEHLRRHLLRLSHDIAHHHHRVVELAFDADGRDVGGSE